MDTFVSMSKRKKNYIVFLNISFLFVASCTFLILHFHSEESLFFKNTLHLRNNNNNNNNNNIYINQQQEEGCKGLHSLETQEAKCSYLKSNLDPCVNQGYIDYLSLFYCKFGNFTFLSYSLLFLWLLVLFYLLGNTASEYFCSSLESLSNFFNLSPTIAGVTLLSLGNGAPDVFSSLVSFMGGGTSEIGLNTVLGGASFISCVVVGVISIVMHKRCVVVNKNDFVRDVFFLLLALLCFAVILVQKEIDLWGAITFFSIYIVYVIVVYFLHMRNSSKNVVVDDTYDLGSGHRASDLTIPILVNLEKGELNNTNNIIVNADEEGERINKRKGFFYCGVLLSILEFPLYLPRRLTIPVISEDKWSKFYAVVSVTLAPILLSILVSHQLESYGANLSWVVYGVGVVIGVTCGLAAYMTTDVASPPMKFALPWLVAGFLMSMTWSYISAQELVGLLVSLAYIVGVNPSILGLTVLAWGNSIGDLVTNLTMALNGGPEGAQIAFSGCYAGPIFNTLFGLGLSLIAFCWSKYPSSVVIPGDHYLLQTLGFLAAGLFWALLVLPRRGMRLDGVFGGGLLVIYIASISVSLSQALGSSAQQLHHHDHHIDAF